VIISKQIIISRNERGNIKITTLNIYYYYPESRVTIREHTKILLQVFAQRKNTIVCEIRKTVKYGGIGGDARACGRQQDYLGSPSSEAYSQPLDQPDLLQNLHRMCRVQYQYNRPYVLVSVEPNLDEVVMRLRRDTHNVICIRHIIKAKWKTE